MQGTVVGSWDATINKIDKPLSLRSLHSKEEESNFLYSLFLTYSKGRGGNDKIKSM